MEIVLDPDWIIGIGLVLTLILALAGIVKEMTGEPLTRFQGNMFTAGVLLCLAITFTGVVSLSYERSQEKKIHVENLNEWSVLSEELEGCNFSQCEEVIVRDFLRDNPDLRLSMEHLEFFHNEYGDIVTNLLVPVTESEFGVK